MLPGMAATMMDIARGLNVSAVTVSKVLRNQGRISEATRKRVLRRAKELNYQMNWLRAALTPSVCSFPNSAIPSSRRLPGRSLRRCVSMVIT